MTSRLQKCRSNRTPQGVDSSLETKRLAQSYVTNDARFAGLEYLREIFADERILNMFFDNLSGSPPRGEVPVRVLAYFVVDWDSERLREARA